jgi:hypothetical protein
MGRPRTGRPLYEAAPEGEASALRDSPACPSSGAFSWAAREARRRSSSPATVCAGRPSPRGPWAPGPRLRGAGGDPRGPLAARGAEDTACCAQSIDRCAPRGAPRSGTQALCALEPGRRSRPGTPSRRGARGQLLVARGARGGRGLALGARRRRGLQRPGAALPLAALPQPQRPPSARAAPSQGERLGASWVGGQGPNSLRLSSCVLPAFQD